MHHVEAAPTEECAQPAAEPRPDRVGGLGAVAPARHVQADRRADGGHLEGRLRDRHRVVLHLGRAQLATGDDRHLVAERGQRTGLTVHVLADPTQGRVVEVGDDRDPHRMRHATGCEGVGTPGSSVPTASRVAGRICVTMPIYEYRCENDHRFELIQKFTDDAVSVCEVCGAPAQRVLHPVAIHFKGSGFYSTDYGRGKKSAASERSESSSDGKSSDSKSSDSKPSESTKSEPKQAAEG